MRLFWTLFAALPAAFCATMAEAAITSKDIQVLGSVLGFMAKPLAGTIRVGIVYAPDNAASTKDQQDMARQLGTGLKVDDVTMVPVAVPTDKLDGAAVDILFVTAGIGADQAKLVAAVKAKKILCLTTDQTLVQTGKCTVAVQSDPSVKIIASKALEEATDVSFAPAFKMMISEI